MPLRSRPDSLKLCQKYPCVILSVLIYRSAELDIAVNAAIHDEKPSGCLSMRFA